MTQQEEWRTVPGFDLYEVSSAGRVLSHQRKMPRVLKPEVTWDGYARVNLAGPNGPVHRKVHQLVAEAFIGPRPEGLQVRHLDGDSRNNSASNIAYGTASDNMQDRLAHGTNPLSKLNECLRGHPFDDANTYVQPSSGKRQCRACRREREMRRAFDAANVPSERAA